MREKAFMSDAQRILLFHTIQFRDEQVRTMTLLSTLASNEAVALATDIMHGRQP